MNPNLRGGGHRASYILLYVLFYYGNTCFLKYKCEYFEMGLQIVLNGFILFYFFRSFFNLLNKQN
jgi:hypothetical protein